MSIQTTLTYIGHGGGCGRRARARGSASTVTRGSASTAAGTIWTPSDRRAHDNHLLSISPPYRRRLAAVLSSYRRRSVVVPPYHHRTTVVLPSFCRRTAVVLSPYLSRTVVLRGVAPRYRWTDKSNPYRNVRICRTLLIHFSTGTCAL